MAELSGSAAHSEMQIRTEQARKLARRQNWAIARRQLRKRRFSEGQIRSWLRNGRPFPRFPGVYAWGRPDLSEGGEMAAAVLFAGEGAALVGLSALWWQGLLGRRPDRTYVAAPRDAASYLSLIHI